MISLNQFKYINIYKYECFYMLKYVKDYRYINMIKI